MMEGTCPLHKGPRQLRCPAMAVPAATACPAEYDVFRVTNVSRKLAVFVGRVIAHDVEEARLEACRELIKPFDTFVVRPAGRDLTIELGEEVRYAAAG